MELFFEPSITPGVTILNEHESKHCINVLRKKTDSTINVTNGKGDLFLCKIIEANSKGCKIELIETIKTELLKPHIHVAIAPTKNIERFEWFLEKATEIGISEITPLICFHSERRNIRIDRCHKIIVSAMKQSLKFTIPILNEPVKFKHFIKNNSSPNRFIAYCDYNSNKKLLKHAYSKNNDALILIGPEGDFSIQEIDDAFNNNFIPISLGKNRLRTETAGIVACNTFSLINEDE
ncbi:MAG: 16S rRNA (uracil(1498)-N(3))-methyltransferase [Marinilabiliaceae bacterium]|nr:16S rRNA (uracil(1498)-N(3))-methyltransferase [Marinilabiliaceae bacterium]